MLWASEAFWDIQLAHPHMHKNFHKIINNKLINHIHIYVYLIWKTHKKWYEKNSHKNNVKEMVEIVTKWHSNCAPELTISAILVFDISVFTLILSQ